MHEEQDMKRMGGLFGRMPVTAVTFLVGALALAGVPPLAGFFAKDQILEIASHTGRVWVYVLGTLGSVLSAAYIGRLAFLTFFGRPRSEEAEHAHESPPVMTWPLVALAAGAIVVGALNLTPEGRLAAFLEPVAGHVPAGEAGLSAVAISVIGTVIALAVLALMWLTYGSGRVDWLALRGRLGSLQRLFANGWYVDKAYSTLVVAPGRAAAAFAADVVDTRVIDGVVNGLGGGTRKLASVSRRLQTGLVRNYALAFLAGGVVLLVYVGLRL
jgi:NADH-quinone oxidoreductase subunit L